MKHIIEILFTLILTLIVGWVNAQVIILNEDFTKASLITPPAGWQNNTVMGQPADLWHFENPGNQTLNLPVSAPFAIFDATRISNDGYYETVFLETPDMDASGVSYVFLSFDHLFRPGTGAKGRVMVFDGNTWNTVVSYTSETTNPGHEVIDLSNQCAGKTNAKIRFQWEGNGSGFWAIDNVRVFAPVALTAGWNIISFNQVPAGKNLKTIFQPLINEGSLVKVQDETGKSIENIGIFGGWINNIGEMIPTEGYKVKVNRNTKISIEGTPLSLPYKIPLKNGWSIMGFPGQKESNAMTVVQPLIDKGILIKVQDETGKSIENLGVFGGWVNNIGSFKPGKGFKIKLNTADTLTVTDKTGSYSVYIYGIDECGYTTLLRQSCTNAGIRFQYCNINSSSVYWSEMWDVVYQFSLGTGGYVLLPVVKVVVDNITYGLERPTVDDIKRLIGN